jgi:hypothetical protein
MYRTEDMEKINQNLSKIKDDAAKEYKTFYEPTLLEMSKVYNAIKNYIKKNNKIVYGGFAQNLLIIKKNPDDAFYTNIDGAYFNWPDIADIEFYSTTPLEDIINLTEELYAQGFKHIEGKEGIHPETYKIFVNFVNYCDISYIPTHINNNMPIIIVDGIKCTNPHFMMVDAYRVLTDPMTSYWRLDKSITRFQTILKYYPIDESNVDKNIILQSTNDSVIKFIRKKIIQKSKLIAVGLHAFNYYAKKVTKKDVIKNIPYYEIISTNYEHDAKFIYNHLNKKFGNKISVKEFTPFFSFLDKHIEFFYDSMLILKLYGNNQRCIVYNYSDKKKTHFGTYNLVMMYLFFEYYYALINRNKQNTQLFNTLIGKFFKLRNTYLNYKKITVIDDSPFKDFTYKCYGIPVESIRSSLLSGLEKRKQGKQMKFRYGPSGKPKQPPDYNFSNISGNQILNEKYLILNKK